MRGYELKLKYTFIYSNSRIYMRRVTPAGAKRPRGNESFLPKTVYIPCTFLIARLITSGRYVRSTSAIHTYVRVYTTIKHAPGVIPRKLWNYNIL